MEVYTPADVKQLYKVTQKQLHDLDKNKIIQPSLKPARGKGSVRLYSFEDMLAFRFIRQLLDARWSIRSIKIAIQNLREILPDKDPLRDFVILSLNGSIIARCSTDNGQSVLMDALKKGQTVMSFILSEIYDRVLEDVEQLQNEQELTVEQLESVRK